MDPDALSPDQRLAACADILAIALLRHFSAQKTSLPSLENCSPTVLSVHGGLRPERFRIVQENDDGTEH